MNHIWKNGLQRGQEERLAGWAGEWCWNWSERGYFQAVKVMKVLRLLHVATIYRRRWHHSAHPLMGRSTAGGGYAPAPGPLRLKPKKSETVPSDTTGT